MAKTILIIGASSAIAIALIEAQQAGDAVYAVSQKPRPEALDSVMANLTWQQGSYQQAEIESLVAEMLQARLHFDQLFICNGILHNTAIMPEKRIENFSVEAYEQVFRANALTPMLWL